MLYILYNVIKLFDWPVCSQHSRFVTFKLNLQSTLIVAVNKEKEQLYLSVNWTSFLLPFDFREVGIINVKIFFSFSFYLCAGFQVLVFIFNCYCLDAVGLLCRSTMEVCGTNAINVVHRLGWMSMRITIMMIIIILKSHFRNEWILTNYRDQTCCFQFKA